MVVVMLLSFTVSCSKETKDVVNATYDPEKSYTMKATQVNTLISDSGITRYRIEAAEWIVFGKAKEPYWYFPEGIYVILLNCFGIRKKRKFIQKNIFGFSRKNRLLRVLDLNRIKI